VLPDDLGVHAEALRARLAALDASDSRLAALARAEAEAETRLARRGRGIARRRAPRRQGAGCGDGRPSLRR
jgi:DNA repair protein RecN (Recombination protein N)